MAFFCHLVLTSYSALIARDDALAPFYATSPPSQITPPLSNSAFGLPDLPGSERTRTGSGAKQLPIDVRSPANTIAILPSSLPDYHRDYMKGGPKHPQHSDPNVPYASPTPSKEEQALTARRLKGSTRSQINLDKMSAKPEPLTQIHAGEKKKTRPTKWQFGIRSRNQPAEAMLAIYRALKAMGAEWEVAPTRHPGGGSRSRSRSRSGSRSSGSRSSSVGEDTYYSDDFEGRDGDRPRRPLAVRNSTNDTDVSRGRARVRYGPHNDWGYQIPEDPWVINARFRKQGMFPPGVAHPSSTQSSRVNLQEAGELAHRRGSTFSLDADTSSGESATRHEKQAWPEPDESVWVYITIQLYSIEKEFFLVDFKSAGYERLVREVMGNINDNMTSIENRRHGQDKKPEGVDQQQSENGDGAPSEGGSTIIAGREVLVDSNGKRYVGAGMATDEKKCTSPFPFLDVASRLIIQLAEGD